MRIQNFLAAFVFIFVSFPFNASAAIINQVDFPDSFVQAKDKQPAQEPLTASTDIKK